MSLKRWANAFTALGALLLAIGALPALFMGLFMPTMPALIPALLSLSVAPLGAVCLIAGLVMWAIALARR